MIMGIDHGYYAIKTRHFSFPAGVTAYTHEPYTLKRTLHAEEYPPDRRQVLCLRNRPSADPAGQDCQ